MILFDRPFQVGDKIRVGEYYGEVVDIGLRTVRIVTPTDSTVSIPNSEIMNRSVSNANSGQNNCQVVADFYLTPNVNLADAKRVAVRAAAVSRYVYLQKPISVVFRNEVHEGRSLIKMSLKAYVLDIRLEFPFLSEMTELVMTALIREGIADPDELAAAK